MRDSRSISIEAIGNVPDDQLAVPPDTSQLPPPSDLDARDCEIHKRGRVSLQEQSRTSDAIDDSDLACR